MGYGFKWEPCKVIYLSVFLQEGGGGGVGGSVGCRQAKDIV